ncbi:effector-associated constant component EACC1 [Nonomuraea fuscirosea]|uniref:effector-associated constant component EACC1 n=1 Tax=Nonomuraea fuscirosea TaxID=1291556 RepID=UPI0034494DEC
MTVQLSIGGDSPSDATRELSAWLLREPELRGRVSLIEAAPEPGTLGAAVGLLQVALGAGGAFATMATIVIAWLGTRRGEVSIKLIRGPGEDSVELTAKGVKGLDAAAARALTEHLAEVLRQADGAGDELAG